MKRRLAALTMALVLGAGISCTCAASNSIDAISEEDVLTTESVEETTTNDTEISMDSSLAKLEAVDESEVAALGLSEQQISEMFAYVAYNISENYLKPNNVTVESSNWLEMSGWNDANGYLLQLFGIQFTFPSNSYDTTIEELQFAETNNDFFNILVKSIFKYCFNVQNYNFEHYDFNLIDDPTNFLNFEKFVKENLTFSDDQLKLGEEVAQEISELEAE